MTEISISESTATVTQAYEAALDWAPLTRQDYHFAFHSNPDRFFDVEPRPYRFIRSKPFIATYENAIYLPASRVRKQDHGCLYDADLNRIQASVTRRGLTDHELNTDPLQLSMDVSSLPVYDEPVLYLGLLRPHYGHYLMQSLATWWALLEDLPDVEHYLFHVFNPKAFDKPVIRATMEAMGIPRERIVFFDEPMRLRQVTVPASSFQAKSHIHSQYSAALRAIARGLGAKSIEPSDQPLYLARTMEKGGVRRYDGEEEVQAFLAERGARVIHPGQMPLHEQVRAVNEHKTLIGFQGSQMMNSMFSLQPKTVVHFTDNRVWPNTLLIDRCFGNDATYVRVASSENMLRIGYRTFLTRTFGKSIKSNNFRTWHKVDHERAIDWLKTSGLV